MSNIVSKTPDPTRHDADGRADVSTLGRRALLMLPLAIVAWVLLVMRVRADERPVQDPRGVESILSRQGFRGIERVQRRGSLWVAEAVAPEGRRIRAVVDSSTGELAGLRPIDGSQAPLRGQPVR